VSEDPWADLARRPELLLVEASISERGRYYHRLGTIVLRKGMRIVEQRATLWHELCHADRDEEHADAKDERRVEREAARRAISIEVLADAWRWSEDVHEIADACKTTVEMLEVRLAGLHPSERGLLLRVESMKERSA
jgi:hypothetical protein